MENQANDNKMNNAAPSVPFAIISQYLKDLSFESPSAPQVFFKKFDEMPSVEVNIDIQAKKAADNTFEVILKVRINNKAKEDTLFLIEVSYGCLVKLSVPKEEEEKVLLIKVPEMLFPYLRSIITSLTQDSGFPPFAMAPIDFNVLYQSRKQVNAEQK